MNKALRLVYNKIVEQSKKNFFFNDINLPNSVDSRLELFQLNLIIILWYMRFSKINKNHIDSIISFFTKDLESLLRESGEAESRIGRKTRKLVENFFGRLYAYTEQFDKIEKNESNELKLKLKFNFNSNSIKISKIYEYVRLNIIYFSKLDSSFFFKLKFDFADN